MAAVEGLLFYDDPLKKGPGLTTIQPWTIGWDEEDSRIRLSLIARAWIALRSSLKHEGAYRAELVRKKWFSRLQNDMAVCCAVASAEPAAVRRCGVASSVIDNVYRSRIQMRFLRGPADGTANL